MLSRRVTRWTLAALTGAALAGPPAANATVSFNRTDIPVLHNASPAAPESVAVADLDGQQGKDIAVALPSLGSVGVMLNNGDGTFAAMTEYSAGSNCVGSAVDITLGDVTQPTGNRLLPDGNIDAYVACTPYVVRLTGDGHGALSNPESFNLGVQQYLGSATLDMLALVHRPDGNPAPLLIFQHAVGSFGRQLCASYELDPGQLACSNTPMEGPLAVGNLNGTQAGVPPDEIVTAEGSDMGVFGFAKVPQLVWSDSSRTVAGGVESATTGDLDNDGDLDVLVGQFVNSLAARVDSIHYFIWGGTGLEQTATTLPSTPGLDAVAIADVDGDGCNDVVGGGDYGLGMIHLGLGSGAFDNGHDLPQLGYQNPNTATRVTMAVDDLTADGQPEIVIADNLNHAVMVYRNDSANADSACGGAPPVAVNDSKTVAHDSGANPIDVLANDTDSDGGPKSIASTTSPAHGTVTVTGGGTSLSYEPTAGYCDTLGAGSSDSFTYTLNGGSTATVTVTVTCPPSPPPPAADADGDGITDAGDNCPAVANADQADADGDGIGTACDPAEGVIPPPPPRTCDDPGTTAALIGTPGADVLVGTAGRDVLSGRAGDDCIYGRSGDDRLSGGTGDDTVSGSSGSDRLDGSSGKDRLTGGNGNDTITPGSGKDKVNAGGGNDTISARDGARDAIDCGAGRDKVTADRNDQVKSNCERVTRRR